MVELGVDVVSLENKIFHKSIKTLVLWYYLVI